VKGKSEKSERKERQKGKQVREEKNSFHKTLPSIKRKGFSCRGREKW